MKQSAAARALAKSIEQSRGRSIEQAELKAGDRVLIERLTEKGLTALIFTAESAEDSALEGWEGATLTLLEEAA